MLLSFGKIRYCSRSVAKCVELRLWDCLRQGRLPLTPLATFKNTNTITSKTAALSYDTMSLQCVYEFVLCPLCAILVRLRRLCLSFSILFSAFIATYRLNSFVLLQTSTELSFFVDKHRVKSIMLISAYYFSFVRIKKKNKLSLAPLIYYVHHNQCNIS